MKRFILAGLVMALFSGTAAFAQNNGGYVDDVYYNGSQAQQDAKADAKKQKKQQTQQQDDAERYNSSTGNNDGYNTDGSAQVYNNSYGNEDDSYIDYDDDSYTSRIRRFYYPMSSVGYWGSVYSPFWYDPFYSNPYYGWGGWYTPGFSIGMGWGGGPYWNNCWGMNTWFGYGGFSSWYSPFGGWGYGGGGWGYGGGYWNGYYAGLYDGGRYNNGYGRGAVNYGPRGARNGLMSNGIYGRSTGMRAANTRNNMVEPINGRAIGGRNGNIERGANNNVTGRGLQVDAQRPGSDGSRNISRNDAIRLDNARTMEISPSAGSSRQAQVQQQEAPARRGFFGNVFRGNNSDNVNRSNNNSNYERSVQPSRSYNNSNFERSSAPTRSYSPSPAPSRSYSPSPSPSRSSFGGGGGGGRMSSGRGR